MNIVVINKDQPNSIQPMVEALRKQDLLNNAVFVFDRWSDPKTARKLANEYGIAYIENSIGKNRQTSYCRNIGFSWFKDYQEGTLFLDGDRFPLEGDLKDLEQSETDITLLKNKEDVRDNLCEPYSVFYGNVYNYFFSNGIYIKKDACKKLIEFYKERKDDYGNSIIFPTSVQQYWGIEDTHLGDICYHLGLTCDINPTIRLNGKFEKLMVDNINIIAHRFRLREKLNVKW